MDDPTEEPLYELILSKVLWGEPKEEVFHRLSVNGITGERAERIYAAAWEERLTVIRRDYARKAGLGLLLIMGAAGIFCFFWFGVRAIPGCSFSSAPGCWVWARGKPSMVSQA